MNVDPPTFTIALLGLGSNLGDRRATLNAAVKSLQTTDGIHVLRVSAFIETEPVGDASQPPQPRFLNGAVQVRTSLSARSLLDECLRIEIEHGRDRTSAARWQARTLDIDLLLFGESVIDEPGLHVPHPRFLERLFALIPAAEIAGETLHPVQRRSVRNLLESLKTRINS
jgi:2-amino-4-hydroxy-6-hydroxymethyldihydropteridine diphosphokinase